MKILTRRNKNYPNSFLWIGKEIKEGKVIAIIWDEKEKLKPMNLMIQKNNGKLVIRNALRVVQEMNLWRK